MSVLEEHVCHKNQFFLFRDKVIEHCNNFEAG